MNGYDRRGTIPTVDMDLILCTFLAPDFVPD